MSALLIASGVPVLISSQSGLADFLVGSGIDTFPSSMVTTRDSATVLATDRWVDAIQQVLDHPDSARAQARELRSAIAQAVSWERSARILLAEFDTL